MKLDPHRPVNATEAALLAFAEAIVTQRTVYGCFTAVSFVLFALHAEDKGHEFGVIVALAATLCGSILYRLTRWRLRGLWKLYKLTIGAAKQ